MTSDILKWLPQIDEKGLLTITHIIEQSKSFSNFNEERQSNNLFELQYANYIGTQNEGFLDVYNEVVKRACYAEFLEWYEYLTKHLLRKDVKEVLKLNIDENTPDWVSEFKSNDLIGWAYQNKSIDVFVQNIEKVKELGKIMSTFFNDRKPLSTVDDDYFESDHAQLVIDSIDKIIIQQDKEELRKQINGEQILCMIEVYGWDNTFNPILLEWIYNNKEVIRSYI